MTDAGKKGNRVSDHWGSLPLACLSSDILNGQWAERSGTAGSESGINNQLAVMARGPLFLSKMHRLWDLGFLKFFLKVRR